MTTNTTRRLAGIAVCLGLGLGSCATSQGAWQKAQEVNTEEAYIELVEAYPNTVYAKYAKERLEEMRLTQRKAALRAEEAEKKAAHARMQAKANTEWARVQATDRVSEHEKFVDEFPDASQVPEALQYIYTREMELAWEVAQGQDSISDYSNFLNNFAVGPHRAEAESRLLALRRDQEVELVRSVKHAITNATKDSTLSLRESDYLKNLTIKSQRTILSYGGDYLHSRGQVFAKHHPDIDPLVPLDLGMFDVLVTEVKPKDLQDVFAHFEGGSIPVGYRVNQKGYLTLVLPAAGEAYELELQGFLYSRIPMP